LQGTAYEELFQERLWIESLGIGLGVWEGTYSRDNRPWLRWYDAEEHWIPTIEEREQVERQRADLAEQQVELERQGRLEEQEARLQAEQQAEQERQRATQAEQQTEQERQRATQAEQRATLLAERLRAMGIEPDSL
jgi:hypothetical protein